MTILDELAAYARERTAVDQAVISLEEMKELAAEIKELDGRCVLVRELENLPFEGSEMLIDPTVSVYGEGETLSVNCPVCGAVVNVARGGAAFCSHCGYKVRLDNDGKVMNNG